MYKVIVAGGRDFDDYHYMRSVLENLYMDDTVGYEDTQIVSGAARGADELAIKFAHYYELPLKSFPADWTSKGRGAGFARNTEMAEYADALVAFWDGQSRGTKHMIDTAMSKGLTVHVYRYNNNKKK